MDRIQLARALLVMQKHEERKKEVREIVGEGYDEFWDNKQRYRVLKGGRGSKKSTTMALWLIEMISTTPLANAVAVRRVGNTNKDSTFAQLKWAARQLGRYDEWDFKVSPLEATYKPTGQKILFRGFDDALKLTSMTVDVGELCWAWIEEAYELESYDEFRTFDESIRGVMPKGLFKQVTLTYNPWINSHWTKEMYWDCECPENVFRLTTDHRCNEFLSEEDHQMYEELLITDPERGKVVARGEYGIPGGTFFTEFRKDIHVIKPFKIPEHWDRYCPLDYGLDMLAGLWIAIDEYGKGYVYKDTNKPNLIISEAAKEMIRVNNNDRVRIRYAPTDLWNRRQETGKSAWDIFVENGWIMTKADRNRENGAFAMKEWLHPYESINEFTGETETIANLRIFDNCTMLINHLSQVQADEKNPNCYATEPHDITHNLDALRYFCIMRTPPSDSLKAPKPSEFLPKALQSIPEPTSNGLAGNVGGGFTW